MTFIYGYDTPDLTIRPDSYTTLLDTTNRCTSRSLVQHCCVGDLGWVADAPEVPFESPPLPLASWMATLSVAGLGGSRGVLTVDRTERR
jgi:hypothetical protein